MILFLEQVKRLLLQTDSFVGFIRSKAVSRYIGVISAI